MSVGGELGDRSIRPSIGGGYLPSKRFRRRLGGRRLAAALSIIDEVLYEVEVSCSDIRFVAIGPGNERIIGGRVPRDESLGELWLEMLWPDDREAHAAFRAALVRGEAAEVTHRVIGLDARVRWIRLRCTPTETVGRWALGAAIASDVTREHALQQAASDAHEQTKRLSQTDSLTGAANRRAFEGGLTAELARAARDGVSLGLFIVDIDHFKNVNDLYGHAAGDEILMAVVGALEQVVRPYDCVGRWGGEEFAVYMPGIADDAGLIAVGEQLRKAVAGKTFVLEDKGTVDVTMSVGAVRSSTEAATVEVLVAAADLAMYAAKRRGRDQVCLFTELLPEDFEPQKPGATQIAEALALSVAQREGMPESHSRTVAELAGRLAESLGLPDLTVQRCRRGGLLHDLGKVGIPDAILAKPGPLSHEEWTVMRGHAAAGGTLVAQIPGLADCAPAVRHHHERWDGDGYPDGLAGLQIPVEARIIAVADAYSTITTDRVYRSAQTPGAALSTLREDSGHHFCPTTVAAFVGLAGLG